MLLRLNILPNKNLLRRHALDRIESKINDVSTYSMIISDLYLANLEQNLLLHCDTAKIGHLCDSKRQTKCRIESSNCLLKISAEVKLVLRICRVLRLLILLRLLPIHHVHLIVSIHAATHAAPVAHSHAASVHATAVHASTIHFLFL